MRPRNTIIAFLFLVVLVGIWLLVDQPFKEEAKKDEKVEVLFPNFDAVKVKKLEITSNNSTVVLNKSDDNKWSVADGDKIFPVDPKSIETVMTKMSEMKKSQVVSTNPEKRTVYQVDNQGTEVKVFNDGAEPAYHFFVGKSGPDFFSTFVRLDGSNDVVLVPEYLKSNFDKTAKTWKDRTMISVEKERIQSLNIEKSDGSVLEVAKKDGAWKLQKPEETAADDKAVDRLLSNASKFIANDFAQPLDPPDYGFDKPSMKITVALDDGTSQIVLIGKEKDKAEYYGKRMDSEWIYTIPKYRYTTFDKKPEELKLQPTPIPKPTNAAEGQSGPK